MTAASGVSRDRDVFVCQPGKFTAVDQVLLSDDEIRSVSSLDVAKLEVWQASVLKLRCWSAGTARERPSSCACVFPAAKCFPPTDREGLC